MPAVGFRCYVMRGGACRRPDHSPEVNNHGAIRSRHQARLKPLTTPDGRYIVVRGRLWRAANPGLAPDIRSGLVGDLMEARREVKAARRADDLERLAAARRAVNTAKIALGERGPVWWTDEAGDFHRHLVKNTPYADWYLEIETP